ncbi:MAG TPA: ParB/RepB/Spo0J family partition protein [Candidatus Saccharimonadales bacterium]|nr:ParB/RepB/Spo0J family partition protein [Candidatus Saccharimonadales bacterium]
MSVKRGLGRGFDALIPTHLIEDAFDPTSQQDQKISQTKDMSIDKVMPNPNQPRKEFNEDSLQELASSIKTHGILLPLIVAPHRSKNGTYMIIAGERRWRAAKIAGLKNVPVLVRSITDQQKLELALIENLQREDLNPLETATAYLKLHEQFNITYDEISKRVGRAMSTISNNLRLLGLPPAAKQALIDRRITEGHARTILSIKEPDIQQELLDLIIQNGWSVRKAEQFVIGYREGRKNKVTAVAKTRVENEYTVNLQKRLGTQVTIKNMAKGGQLMISFKSDEDLARITKLLGS